MNQTTLAILEELIDALTMGCGLRKTIASIIKNKTSPLHSLIEEWVLAVEKDAATSRRILKSVKSPENVSLLLLIECGLRGQPILESLVNLRTETLAVLQIRSEQYMQMLPYKMLVPQLVFFFPALMWSFLAPFLHGMQEF